MAVATIDLHLAHPLDIARRRRAGERNVMVQRFLPGFRAGKVLASIQRIGGDVTGLAWHDDPLAAAIEQTEAMLAEIEESHDRLRLVLGPEDWPRDESEPQGVLLHLEGLAPIGESLPVLEAFHRLGVRSAQLTWNARNAVACGVAVSDGDRGLTAFGRSVVHRMNELGVVIDLAHLAPEGVRDVLAITRAPVVNTHANARALCDHPRNLTDDQMRAIVATGGLVAAVAYGEFIDPDRPTLERLIDHIEYMVELVGVENVGVGSDFTDYASDVVAEAAAGAGIYAAEYGFPTEFDTVSKFPALWEGLARRGYETQYLEAIAGGNFRRVFGDIAAAGAASHVSTAELSQPAPGGESPVRAH